MTDITPADGFAAAFAEAEAAALGTDAPTPEVDTATTTETPAAVEPEPAAEAPVVEEPTAAERLLAGKYKTVEELERAYTEAQKMIPESADWRREMDALRSEMAAQQAATMAAPPVQITADLIERDPASAALLAYEQDNGQAFQIAFNAWREEDSGAALAWANSKQTEESIKAVEQRYEQKFADLEQRFAPAAAQLTAQQQATELGKVAQDFPEIPALLENGKIAEIAAQFPDMIGAGLISADPAKKAGALRAAAEIARGRQGETLRATTQEVARQTADEARQAAEDAHVVSATSATSSATEQISPEQEIANSVLTRVKARQDGWNQAWVRNG